MIQKLTNKLNDRKNNKGFTLVELIVVIVILAILAAILIPGLLKWIDKAKEEKYVLEARNILLATEAELAECYASGRTKPTMIGNGSNSDLEAKIKDLTGIEEIQYIQIEYVNPTGTTVADWEIKSVLAEFVASSDGNRVSLSMIDGVWHFNGYGWGF